MSQHTAPTITIIPAKPALAAGRNSTTDFLIRIESPAPIKKEGRRPLNFGIVLDRSGSMAFGDKLHCAKEAVAFAVRQMADDDHVSLTIYDNRVQMLIGAMPVAQARPRIAALLSEIAPGNTTALHDAWLQGGLEVTRVLDPSRLNRVLLLSDGLANVGVTDPDTIVQRAGELFARGVSTSTIGVGSDFNEDLMIPMAAHGGGAGWFVESPADFKKIFEAELAGLALLFGERAVLRIEPRRPGTRVVEILNDLPVADPVAGAADSGRPAGAAGAVGWQLGNLIHGQPLEIVARIEAHGGEEGQPLDLFDVRLACDVIGHGRIELQQLTRVVGESPEKVAAMTVNPEVDRVVELLKAARARTEAIGMMDRGDYSAAVLILGTEGIRMSERHARLGDTEALKDAGELHALKALLEQSDDPVVARSTARKFASYQSYARSKRSRRST